MTPKNRLKIGPYRWRREIVPYRWRRKIDPYRWLAFCFHYFHFFPIFSLRNLPSLEWELLSAGSGLQTLWTEHDGKWEPESWMQKIAHDSRNIYSKRKTWSPYLHEAELYDGSSTESENLLVETNGMESGDLPLFDEARCRGQCWKCHRPRDAWSQDTQTLKGFPIGS